MECDYTWCKRSSKTDRLSIWPSAKYKIHIIIMATMTTGTMCNIRGSDNDCRVIVTRFDPVEYVGRFSPRTATFYCWRWFCNFQIELARPIISIQRFRHLKGFSDAESTSKIIFVKFQSGVVRNIWKRSLIQTLRRYKFNKPLATIELGSQETVNQTTSCQYKLFKQQVQHIGEVRSC